MTQTVTIATSGADLSVLCKPQTWFKHPSSKPLLASLTSVPFALFFIGVAIGQSQIIGFFIWVYLACFVGGLPLLIAVGKKTFKREALISSEAQLTKRNEPETHLDQRCGKLQGFAWNGWQTCHTSIPNSDSKVPIILVHGFGGSIGHWRQNMPALAQHHSVYALDLLGFGASEKPDIAYSLDLWVEQLYAYWKSYVKVPAILVGNSLGSVTCLAASARYPEMVKGVAMISLPDPPLPEGAPASIMQLLLTKLQSMALSPVILKPLFYWLRQPWMIRHWVQLAYACKEAVTDELLEILMAPARDKNSANAFCTILKAILNLQLSLNVQTALSQLKIPSLLIWGRCDRMVPIAAAYRFLKCNPALRLIELEDAGHCAHDERPDQVNWELLNWITTCVLPIHQSEEVLAAL